MQKKIKINLGYFLAKQYMLFGFKQFYSNITIIGKENLPPDDCAIIFAPNHLNALMDALSVALISPKNKDVVFLAKADLFISKTVSYFLHFAKIFPAYRKNDGIQNLSKNNQSFEICINALQNNEAIGIMPEGGQGEKHFIRPLVKGIFRIAFEAQRQFGTKKSVMIVPVGINMDNLFKCNHNLMINIGKPIEIKDYIDDYDKNPSATINTAKQKLSQALSCLTLDIASDDYYETIKFISDIEGYKFIPQSSEKDYTLGQFYHKQEIINSLLRIQREEPEKMKSIDNKVMLIQKEMSKLKLTPAVFSVKKISITALILGFPFFLFGFITNFLPMFVPVWIRKLIRVEYDGFYSSVQFGLGLISFPVFYILQTLLFYKFIISGIWWSIIFFVFQYISRTYALFWWKNGKKKYKKQILKKNEQKLVEFAFGS